MFTQDISVIVSKTLGLRKSSHDFLGDVLATRSLGQANITLFANVDTGNIFLRGPLRRIIERGFTILVGAYYNSQAEKGGWRVSMGRRLEWLKSGDSTQIVLINEEGALLTFVYDVAHKHYVAQGLSGGDEFLCFDKAQKIWTWKHPSSGISEHYGTDGLQKDRCDLAGNTLSYTYDAGRLTQIKGSSGQSIQWDYSENKITVSLHPLTGNLQVLQTYRLDAFGRVIAIEIPVEDGTPYTVHYGYDAKTRALDTISQSDGTCHYLKYTGDLKKPIISQSIDGEKRITQFDFSKGKTAVYSTSLGKSTAVVYTHANGQLIQVDKPTGTRIETVVYQYDSKGRLEKTTYPSSATESRTYNALGLIDSTTDGLGQRTHYHRDPATGVCFSRVQTIQSDQRSKALPTWFVYDEKRQLRYEINAVGTVTRHMYDDQGNRIETRVHLTQAMEVSSQPSDQPIAQSVCESWWQQQPINQTDLIQYIPNALGQIQTETHFAYLDEEGTGIADGSESCISTQWSPFGTWFLRREQRDKDTSFSTVKKWDGLDRCIEITDSEDNKTCFTYAKSSQTVVTADQLLTKTLMDASGRLTTVKRTDLAANTPTRTTLYERDAAGRLYLTIHPDHTKTQTQCDPLGRVILSIDAAHYAQSTTYDEKGRVEAITTMSTPVDPHTGCKTASHVQDRTTTWLYNAADQLRYHIDAFGAVTERVYDEANRCISTTHYYHRLFDSVARTLTNNRLQGLVVDPKKDRKVRFHFDDAGYKIVEQDAEQFVKKSDRDAAGRIKSITWYKNPSDESMVGAEHVFYRDARGQVIAEQDAEHYLTTHTYFSEGLIRHTCRYATQVNGGNTTPTPSSEDHSTAFNYDGLQRETVRIESPLNRQTNHHYDALGRLLVQSQKDTHDSDPRGARTQVKKYDAYGAVIASVDERGAEKIAEIETNSSLSPQEKTQQIAQFWQDHATHHKIDPYGFCVKTTDPLGSRTIYYYTPRRELAFRIDANGYVTENNYNAFGEKVRVCRYKRPIEAETLKQLTGGRAENDVVLQKALQDLADPAHDSIQRWEVDRVNNTMTYTDAEAFKTITTKNAFAEVEKKQQQVAAHTWQLQNTDYDRRGLVVETQVDPESLALNTRKSYDFQKKLNTWVAPTGAKTTYIRDRLGRVQSLIDALGQCSEKRWDAFSRLLKHTDKAGHVTTTHYDTKRRCRTETSPEGRQLTTVTTVFEQTQSVTDSNGSVTCFTYEAGGLQTQQTLDALGLKITTQDQFDLCGRCEIHTEPNGCQTYYIYDSAGRVHAHVEAPNSFIATTVFTLGHLDLEIAVTNPIMVQKTIKRDRRGQIVEERVPNPSGTDFLTLHHTNGLGQDTLTWQGDSKKADQRVTQHLFDSAQRETGKIIDPEGLKLQTLHRLDANGAVIVTQDPNGFKTHSILDALSQKRFTVLPNGGVVGYELDQEGRLVQQRAYITPVDVNRVTEKTTSAEMQALVEPNVNDRVVHYRYDRDGKQRYKIDALGAITQYHYDSAGHRIGSSCYQKTIETRALKTKDTDEITAWLKQIKSPTRSHYNLLDAAGREVITIDPMGVVVEKTLDVHGNLTKVHRYAIPIKVSQLKALTPKAVRAVLISSPEDRIMHQLFDVLDRAVFHIDEAGYVTETEYDKVNQPKTTTVYLQRLAPLPSPLTLYTMHRAVQNLPKQQRMTINDYDVMRHRIYSSNALHQEEHWSFSALGECLTHTDRAQNVWENRFDAAGRRTHELTPAVEVAVVEKDADNPGHLKAKETIKARLISERAVDANGNTVAARKGYEDPRSQQKMIASEITFAVDALNHTIGTTMCSVLVEDPTKVLRKPEDRSDRPVTVTTKRLMNTFGQPIVDIDENGHAHFTAYDTVGRIQYRVQANGLVTEFTRNAFGEVSTLRQYAIPISLDLSQFIKTGLSCELVKAHITTSEEDRTLSQQFDNAGRLIELQQSEVFVTTVNEKGEDPEFQCDYTAPVMKKSYNSFGEVVCETHLLEARHSQWAHTRQWFDLRGKLIATADAEGGVTVFAVNVDGLHTLRYEYAQPLDPARLIAMDYATLLKTLTPSAEDRVTETGYDVLGRTIETRLKKVVLQSITLDKQGVPHMQDSTQDVVTTYDLYDLLDHVTQTSLPNQAQVLSEYDALGRMRLTQNAPRPDADRPGIVFLEQKIMLFTALHQVAIERRTVKVKAPQVPEKTALKNVPEDQIRLKLWDNRGLCVIQQDARGNPSAQTYTATHLPARRIQWVTGWNTNASARQLQSSEDVMQTLRLYELKKSYDKTDRLSATCESQVMTGTSLMTYYRRNLFGDVTGISEDNNTWVIEQRYDRVGRVWYNDTDRGIPSLQFMNAKGEQTGQLRSLTQDLGKIQYHQLPQAILTPPSDGQHIGLVLNNKGQIKTQYLPQFRHLKGDSPEPLHTAISIGASEFGSYSLSWPMNPHALMEARLILNRGTEPLTEIFLTPTTNTTQDKWGVDVSHLIADRYHFTLLYYFKEPDPQDPTRYRTNFNPCQGASGTLVLDTKNLQGSEQLVGKMIDEETLLVTGKTEGVQGVALVQHNKIVAKAGLTLTEIPGRFVVRLSDQKSGTYDVQAIKSSEAIGQAFRVGHTDPSGRQLRLVRTQVSYAVDILTRQGWIQWSGAPPGFHTLQGEYGYSEYVSEHVFKGYTLMKVQKASTELGKLDFSQPINSLPVTCTLYGLGESGKKWFIGEAANSELPKEMTAIPSYLYFYPAPEDKKPELLIVIDPSTQQVKGSLGLMQWANGWYRAEVSQLMNVAQYQFQAASLGAPDPEQKVAQQVDVFAEDLLASPSSSSSMQVRTFSIPDFTLKTILYKGHHYTQFNWRAPKGGFYRQPFHINYQCDTSTQKDVEVITHVGHAFKFPYYPGGSRFGSAGIYWASYENIEIEVFKGDPTRIPRSGEAVYEIQTLLIHPIPPNTDCVQFRYKFDVNDDRVKENSEWQSLPVMVKKDRLGDARLLSIALNKIDAGKYPFQMQLLDADQQPIPVPDSMLSEKLYRTPEGWLAGHFTRVEHYGDVVTVAMRDQFEWAKPKRSQELDRWGNPRVSIDALGHQTRSTFNRWNQLATRTEVCADYVDKKGHTHTAALTTRYGVDALHQSIGLQKPSGSVKATLRNPAGDPIKIVTADGVWEAHSVDGFGRVVTQKTATVKTDFTHDCENLVTSITDGEGNTTHFTYNERGLRQSTTNANAETTREDYDEKDRVVRRILPAGQLHSWTYHRSGQIEIEDNKHGPAFQITQFYHPFFGIPKKKIDKSGTVLLYDVNRHYQTTKITTDPSTRGRHGQQYRWLHKRVFETTPDQNLSYVYDEAGHRIWILDIGNRTYTRYRHDRIGRRIGERFFMNDVNVYQDTNIDIDSRGLTVCVQDLRMQGVYSYDANKNLRHVVATYKQQSPDLDPRKAVAHTIEHAEHWFDYNAADLMTIDRGCLKQGVITIKPGKGTVLTFNFGGQRESELTLDCKGNQLLKTIHYLNNGWVNSTRTIRAGGLFSSAQWGYQKGTGRRIVYQFVHADRSGKTYYTDYDPIGTAKVSNGWISHQKNTVQHSSSLGLPALENISETQYTHYFEEGQLERQVSYSSWDEKKKRWDLTQTLESHYIGFDQMQLFLVSGEQEIPQRDPTYGEVFITYDANGQPQSVNGDVLGHDGFRWFAVNAEGRVVFKRTGAGEEFFIYDPNGISYGWMGDLPSDPTGSDVPAKVNFAPWYHAVSRHWPPAAPQSLVAHPGDTFESIAEQLGSTSYAYELAQMNGYGPEDAIPEGATIRIPSTVDFNRFNQAAHPVPVNTGAILGTFYPYMPIAPAPHPHSFFLFLGELVEVAVGTLVALLVPELMPTIGGTWGPILTAMLRGALVAGLSDAAQQSVGMILGLQSQWNWKELGEQFETGLIAGLIRGEFNIDELQATHEPGLSAELIQAQQKMHYLPQLGLTLLRQEVITLGSDMALSALGQKKKLDYRDLLNAACQSLLKVSSAQGLAHLHLSLPLTLFLDDMLNGTLGDLFSAAVYHDKFNPLESAARSMAVFAAQKAAQSLEKAKHPRKVQEPEEPARTAMMQDAKSAGYALKLPVAFIDDPIDMAEQAYATGTDSSGELLPKAGQQAANSSFFGHQSYAVTVPFTARQQQKNQINTDAYQHSLRQWQARQVRQAHVSADNSSLGHGNLVNSQRAQALTIKEVQGWLYTLATSQWEQTASPSTRVHESWWNTMKFGLLESLHEEANLVREYVQKPLLEGLESTLSGVSYIADELAPVFLNTPYTVSEGAALEELALGTARVAHFFGETAKSSALIRRIGLFGRGEIESLENSVIRSRVLSNIVETKVGNKASFYKIHTLAVKTHSLDVSTSLDEAIFWSGRGNRELAENFASLYDYNRLTLEMTPGGQYLSSLGLFDKYPGSQAIVPWERLSEKFAQGASGRVSAFVEGSRPGSVFNRIEYPALLENPNIEEIIYSPEYINNLVPK